MNDAFEVASCQLPFRQRPVALWRASFAHGVGAPVPHPPDDRLRHFDEHVPTETNGAPGSAPGRTCRLRRLHATGVMQSYMDVAHLGQGIGSRLLDLAKAGSGGKPWLHPFVIRTTAQRFCERHGVDIVERGFEPVMQRGDLRHEWKRAGR